MNNWSNWIYIEEKFPKTNEDIIFYVYAEKREYHGCYNAVRGLWFGKMGAYERCYNTSEVSRWRYE